MPGDGADHEEDDEPHHRDRKHPSHGTPSTLLTASVGPRRGPGPSRLTCDHHRTAVDVPTGPSGPSLRWSKRARRRTPPVGEERLSPHLSPARTGLADTADGAWAEFLRHESIADPEVLEGVSLWAVNVTDTDVDGAFTLDLPDDLGYGGYRHGEVGVRFGARPELRGWPCVQSGSPSADLLTAVRPTRPRQVPGA